MTSPPLVTPFRGERFASGRGDLSRLIAPPYDVITAEQRQRYAALDPHNIVHLILPEAPGGADKYASAAQTLAAWRHSGVLSREPGPSVYVVAQIFVLPNGERRTRVGMFGAVVAEPYDRRRIRPHERTHSGPKADRLALLRATATSLESIFLIAPDDAGALAAALRSVTDGARTPDASAELDGVQIMVWVVAGDEGARLAQLASAGALYIADGHHRYETAVAYSQEERGADRLTGFIVSARDSGLAVLATHRLIYAVGRDFTQLHDGWGRWFEISKVPPAADRMELLKEQGRDRTACIVALRGEASDLLLRLRPNAPLDTLPELGRSPAARSLDVAIVERLVVQEILAAGTSTPTLTFTPEAKRALDLAHAGKTTASVLLNPTRIEQVIAVADAGDYMPPKSTYFTPKVPSGLVLKSARE
jgi:uncharacterized protein (DUF1015 family)